VRIIEHARFSGRYDVAMVTAEAVSPLNSTSVAHGSVQVIQPA
jgi:hypothetical protein